MELDRNRLLGHLKDEEERAIGARVVDLARAVLASGEPRATDFLDPHQRLVAEGVAGAIAGLAWRASGGYRGAERQRLLLFPDLYLTDLLEWPLRYLAIEPAGEAKLTHRDYLGALLGTGLRREKLGDLIVTALGCQAVVAAEAAAIPLSSLQRVGDVPVRVQEIDPEQLEVPPERVKEIRATVASLRLDAVASTGFGVSRTRMAQEIKAERVKVNWRGVRDPAHPVRQGDVLSIRGRGRVVIAEVTGTTRKGRIGLLLKRYL